MTLLEAGRDATLPDSPGATRRVLVVDDDIFIRDTVAEILDFEGHDVRTACHGREALDLLTACASAGSAGWQPDVILLDMRMPVLDGWQFARLYRELPGPRAAIVVMSAAHDALRWSHEVHANDCLAKPFDVDDLLRCVETATTTTSGAPLPIIQAGSAEVIAA